MFGIFDHNRYVIELEIKTFIYSYYLIYTVEIYYV